VPGTGAVPHIALEDAGHYVRWIFDNPARANGMDLAVATEHVHYGELAAAFSRVTGKPAQYIPTDLETYFAAFPATKLTVGSGSRPETAMTFEENFTGFWNLWHDSGENKGVVRRDYELLDEIHPGRIRSVEEYLRRRQEGLWESVQPENMKPVLKSGEDGRTPFAA
jgi:hypothetical protein